MATIPADNIEMSSSASALWKMLQRILKPLASLQLTVVLFAISLGLVFFGTLAQMNNGIWTVVQKYFWSYVVWVDLQLFVQFGQIFFGIDKTYTLAGSFPFMGGKLLGALMLINLTAAHLVRFKLSWRRSGILVLHAGLILLFVGEFITRIAQVEQRMVIDEGKSANYAEDTRTYELAFVNISSEQDDIHTVISEDLLKEAQQTRTRIQHPDLPFDVEVLEYYVNSSLHRIGHPKVKGVQNLATNGAGERLIALKEKEVSGVEIDQNVDIPAAYIKLYRKGTDESVGVYLVTRWIDEQTISADDTKFEIALRPIRFYKPFRLELLDFRADRYVGTSTARNYSSQIVIHDPERGVQREVLIRMNEPLRYRGEAFFQADFDKRTEKTTVLQVVRNPGWFLPYLSCVLVTLGMLMHFGLNLTQFLSRIQRKQGSTGVVPGSGAPVQIKSSIPQTLSPEAVQAGEASALRRYLPWAMLGIATLYLMSNLFPRTSRDEMNLRAAAAIPVVDGGRIKPLDTVARVNMRLISNREEFVDTNEITQPAIKWYFDSASAPSNDPGPAGDYRIFRIENDRVRDLLGLPNREGMRYSLREIQPKADVLNEEARKAAKRPKKDLDLVEKKILDCRRQIENYLELWLGANPLVIPKQGDADWKSYRDVQESIIRRTSDLVRARVEKIPDIDLLPDEEKNAVAKRIFDEARQEAWAEHPVAMAWRDVLLAYRMGDPQRFNDAVESFIKQQNEKLSLHDRMRVKLEVFLNQFAPFYHCTGLYLFALVLCVIGWAVSVTRPESGEAFRRSALAVIALTFLVHSFSLLSRMYLMDRPLVFVTNLYSSAVFIGCAAVGVCLLIEWLYPIGIGNAVGAVIGFGTSVIAHNLAAAGDTLEMMEAVLDTNFWLASHVTSVTFGYSATYVAGAIGIAYLIIGIFTPYLQKPINLGTNSRPEPLGKLISKMIYGVLCLATLFSFVGTVLGGIWADQSWGRFWGWDPKENGAILIVVINALILHARWAGIVRDRGIAILTLVGNMITTWSWFGTNQLGVGLHAYGFNNKLVTVCVVMWASHLFLIALGLLPQRFWASYASSKVRATQA